MAFSLELLSLGISSGRLIVLVLVLVLLLVVVM